MERLRPAVAGLGLGLLAACGGGPAGAPPATAPAAPGAALYARYCVACHMADGSAREGLRPALAGSATVSGPLPALAAWVLYGERPATLSGRPYPSVMPRYAGLSDEELALILTYIRGSFGNAAGPVAPADIAAVRSARAR